MRGTMLGRTFVMPFNTRRTAFALAVFTALSAAPAAQAEGPTFKVDPFWPKALPNNWIMGQVGGMTVDAQDHIWINQRPRSLTKDEAGAAQNPPQSKCCVPAPSIMEFDAAGTFLKGWGGPGEGYDWPEQEHALRLDGKGNIYFAGNGAKDQMLLKFTTDGKFVKQLGKLGMPMGSKDTNSVGRVADIFYDAPANELYLADGYGNHRIMVVDADSFAFKRMWGAYGKTPSDENLPMYTPASQQFANPVHCVKIANDGLVYVCDRSNNRIQVFQKNGTFVREFVFDKDTRQSGSTWDMVFWPDRNQSYIIVADGTNNLVRVARRSDGQVVSSFGTGGRQAGQFHWVHVMAVDSHGNLYTGEVDTGKRIQKFTPNIAP
jgi:sugar lactone lactonase YvrE